MPRDPQKNRVYAAQRVINPLGKRIEKVPAIQSYVDQICASRKFKKITGRPAHKVKVLDGRARRSACGCPFTKEIKIPKFYRSERTIIHELAHTLAYDRHGPEFCWYYIQLVDLQFGSEAAESLRESFRANRVDWTTPKLIKRKC